MARNRKPVFSISAPSKWNGGKWYADSTRLGMRYGPYDTEAQAQASVDNLNALTMVTPF